jgi:hypothetical protein
MKKSLTFIAVALLSAALTNCGNSAEDKAEKEGTAQDSVAVSNNETTQPNPNADSGKVMMYDEHGNPIPASTATAEKH